MLLKLNWEPEMNRLLSVLLLVAAPSVGLAQLPEGWDSRDRGKVKHFPTVALMQADYDLLRDDDIIITDGYTTAGDGGGNEYRYDQGSAATADGGFVITATTGRFIATNQSVANVRQFGVTDNGTSDNDSTTFAAALAAAEGKTLELDGCEVNLGTAVSDTFASDTAIIGPGKIYGTLGAAGDVLTITQTGTLTIRDVILDGNNDAEVEGMLRVNGASGNAYLENIDIQNCDSDTSMQAIQLDNDGWAECRNVTANGVYALANTITGDANGSVRVLYLSGDFSSCLVDGFNFQNVHSRDGVDVPTQEDADAIQIDSLATPKKIIIRNGYGSNIGKRLLKAQAASGYVELDNVHLDCWSGTGDAGTISIAESFIATGTLVMNNVTADGGRLRHLLANNGADVCIANNCTVATTYSATVGGSAPYVFAGNCNLLQINGGKFTNVHWFVDANTAGIRVEIDGVDVTTQSSIVDGAGATDEEVVISNSRFDRLAASGGTIFSAGTSFRSVAFTNVEIDGNYTTGVTIPAQSAGSYQDTWTASVPVDLSRPGVTLVNNSDDSGNVDFGLGIGVYPSNAFLTLDAAISAAESPTVGGHVIVDDAQTLTADVTADADVTVEIVAGGSIDYDTWNLTINGGFKSVDGALIYDAADHASGTGDLILAAGSCDAFEVNWWDGTSVNDHLLTQEAIDCASKSGLKTVQMRGAYTFFENGLSTDLEEKWAMVCFSEPHDGIWLRGDGMDSTVITLDSGVSNTGIVFQIEGRDERCDDVRISDLQIVDSSTGNNYTGIRSYNLGWSNIGNADNPSYGVHRLRLERIKCQTLGRSSFYIAGDAHCSDLWSYQAGQGSNSYHSFVGMTGTQLWENIHSLESGNFFDAWMALHDTERFIDNSIGPAFKTNIIVDGFVSEDDINGAKMGRSPDRIITAQDETSYDNSPASEGTFSGGTGHSVSDVITLTDGTTVTVDAVSTGVVTQFTIDSSNWTKEVSAGSTVLQDSTTGSGTGFSLTLDTGNVETAADALLQCTIEFRNGRFTMDGPTRNALRISTGGDKSMLHMIGRNIHADGGIYRLTTAQDETSYDNSPTTEGTFAGGSGHAISDVLTLASGVTVTVDNVSAGVVTEFTVNSTAQYLSSDDGTADAQVSTTGSGTGFSLTPDSDNLPAQSNAFAMTDCRWTLEDCTATRGWSYGFNIAASAINPRLTNCVARGIAGTEFPRGFEVGNAKAVLNGCSAYGDSTAMYFGFNLEAAHAWLNDCYAEGCVSYEIYSTHDDGGDQPVNLKNSSVTGDLRCEGSDDLVHLYGTFSGTKVTSGTEPDYIMFAEGDRALSIGDGTTSPNIDDLAQNGVATTANTTSTTISSFTRETPGQVWTLIITDANTTVADDDVNIDLNGDVNFSPAGRAAITFTTRDGVLSEEISRTVF